MSPIARVLIVLALLSGAALFLLALTSAAPGQAEEATRGEQEAGPVPTGPGAEPGVLDSSKSCKECHEEIYDEWKQDRHSKAWTGALYTEKSKNHTDPNCWSCHAPRPVFETGLDSPAETRAGHRAQGITCLTCHKSGDHVLGSIRDPRRAACGPAFDARHPGERAQEATSRFCGVCHNLHGTCDEFAGSRYAREGKTCLSCHMEEKPRGPVAKGGPVRNRRSHVFRGGHSEAMLRKAMSIEGRRVGDSLVARVRNKGAGHRVPTDARHRAIYLHAEFFDREGQVVTVTTPNGRVREAEMDLIRLFYRQEQRDPTQIDPEGTLGRVPWRESSIEIPAGAMGGHAILRLRYFLRIGWPKHKGTLVAEKQVSLE